MLDSPLSLATVAESKLLSMADVAFLSRIPMSTLSRLWRNELWLDRVSGATLQQLIAAIPGLGEYVTYSSHRARLAMVMRECHEVGLEVSVDRLVSLSADGGSVTHTATALMAAACIMRLDPHEALMHLARCWGSAQDQVLEALFLPHGLLPDPAPLMNRAVHLVERLDIGENALHTTLGYGILVHKLTKWIGDVPIDVSAPASRCAAFAYRSRIVGLLLNSNDIEIAEAYDRNLVHNPLLVRNELWSLASYCADVRPVADFSISTRCGLRNTATEIIADIANRNDAYLHYLVASSIPILLDYDPSFGSLRIDLTRALRSRINHGADCTRTRAATIKLINSIK